jgi:hypothetical protein
MTSGIVMYASLQQMKHLRGIVTDIHMEFLQKARGTIRAVGSIESALQV